MLNLLVFLLGLIIGSFLTVCIFRTPYGREKGPGDFGSDETDEAADTGEEASAAAPEAEGLSLVSPARSFCPACRRQLYWWHNIPLLSWLLLRGRCGFCGERIPVTYPVVELLSGLTCLWSFIFFPLPTAVVVYIFCAALIVLSFIDAEYYILPNVITVPGMIAGAGLAVVNHFGHWFQPPVAAGVADAFWGLLAGGGFLFVVSEGYYLLRKRVGLGFGDVKLLAMTGLIFGPEIALGTIFVGSLVGAVGGGLAILAAGHKASRPLPFGPYLAMATLLCLFIGVDQLLAGFGAIMSSLFG